MVVDFLEEEANVSFNLKHKKIMHIPPLLSFFFFPNPKNDISDPVFYAALQDKTKTCLLLIQ
jgi:hypothetical protein